MFQTRSVFPSPPSGPRAISGAVANLESSAIWDLNVSRLLTPFEDRKKIQEWAQKSLFWPTSLPTNLRERVCECVCVCVSALLAFNDAFCARTTTFGRWSQRTATSLTRRRTRRDEHANGWKDGLRPGHGWDLGTCHFFQSARTKLF